MIVPCKIQWHTGKHAVTIAGIEVILTPMQYRVLYPLRHSIPIAYSELARLAYNCEMDGKVQAMIDKHVDRIRGKLRGTGVYIYCVHGYGYLLFDEDLSKEGEQPNLSGRRRIL